MTIAQSIRFARNGIIGLLNQSGLPIDVMDLLLQEIHASVHQQAEDAWEKEKKAVQQTEKSDSMVNADKAEAQKRVRLENTPDPEGKEAAGGTDKADIHG